MRWTISWMVIAAFVVCPEAYAQERVQLSVKLPDLKSSDQITAIEMTAHGAAIIDITGLRSDWDYKIDNGSAETSNFQAQTHHTSSSLHLPEDAIYFRNILTLRKSDLLCKPNSDPKGCIQLSLSGNLHLESGPNNAETWTVSLTPENFVLTPVQ